MWDGMEKPSDSMPIQEDQKVNFKPSNQVKTLQKSGNASHRQNILTQAADGWKDTEGNHTEEGRRQKAAAQPPPPFPNSGR